MTLGRTKDASVIAQLMLANGWDFGVLWKRGRVVEGCWVAQIADLIAWIDQGAKDN